MIIDVLFADLERAGVNTQQFRVARRQMDKEQLRNTLTQLLKAHVTQSVYREQLSDKFVCPKCGRSELADRQLMQAGFCQNCGVPMEYQRAV
jgi:predicted RNA-binding Zn-ribbon protein involved in translation (DUF1610 family)